MMRNTTAELASSHTGNAREDLAAQARSARLSRLLERAAEADGDTLYPALADLLLTHIDYDHLDKDANSRIRDLLDHLELLLALEIERLGLRRESLASRMLRVS